MKREQLRRVELRNCSQSSLITFPQNIYSIFIIAASFYDDFENYRFLKQWDQCISWEASLSMNLQKDIWAFSSKDREEQGR